VDRDLLAVAGLDMPVDTVIGDVELAAHEPLGEGRVAPVENLVPLGVPVQSLGLFRPEALRSASASWYSSGPALAAAANSSDGGNVLLSVSRLSSAGPWPDCSVIVGDLLGTDNSLLW